MFKCDCCGQCCRNIGGVKVLEALDSGDGVCIFLNREENLCRIYGSRPLFCNVDAMYDVFFRDEMTREEFYSANYSVCEELKNGGAILSKNFCEVS